MKHSLYDCRIVECIWKKIGSFLKIDVTWKVIENNDKTIFFKITMFKYKMKCRVLKEKNV